VFFIDGKLRIDDPVGAISVHGVNGLWGILSLGLLADGTYGDGWNGVNGAVRGLLYGDASQFVAQLIGGAANIVGVGVMALVAYKVTAFVVGATVWRRTLKSSDSTCRRWAPWPIPTRTKSARR